MKILTVRLGTEVTPQSFASALQEHFGLFGRLALTWLHADWFAVPEAAEAAMRARVSDEQTLVSVLHSAGAAEGRWVSWDGFVALTRLRDSGSSFTVPALRGQGGVPIEPSPFPMSVPPGPDGRALRLDWYLTLSGISGAWALFDPASRQLAWRNVRVGHIDTGITEHPAFGFGSPEGSWLHPDLGLNLHAERTSAAGGEGFDLSWAISPELGDPFDNMAGPFAGHGTRTASLITGHYDTGELRFVDPFYGAAPGVPLVPYRVTDSVIVDHVMDLVARAIQHAIEQNGCQVISISLGGIGASRALSEAIDFAYERGVIICAAAGNLIREVTYPGRFNRVVTVSGITTSNGQDLAPWDGASHGKFVDISGPADQIRRASVIRRRGHNEYMIAGPGDGTSFATALCAGIAVLWIAHRAADLDAAYGDERWMRVAAFKRLIKETARTVANWQTGEYGAGLYQADRLLAAALPAPGALHREALAAEPFDSEA